VSSARPRPRDGALEEELSRTRSLGDETLRRFVAAHGLRGALLLGDGFQVVHAVESATRRVAPGDGPFTTGRIARLEAESLARRAREAGLAERERIVFGFGENPFGARSEFLVGIRAAKLGGFLLLRHDAAELERFQEQAGLRRLLASAARGPGITYLALQGADGSILVSSGAAGPRLPPPTEAAIWRLDRDARVLDVTLPAPWDGPPEGHLRVGLAAEPVEESLAGARRTLLLSTALVLLTGVGGLLLLASRERRAHARQSDLRRELEQRERFASLGRLAGGVAHEVRSPLNALSMASQRLRRELRDTDDPDGRLRGLEEAIAKSVRRLDDTVRGFLELGSGGPPPERTRFGLGSLVDEAIEAEAPDAERRPAPGPLEVSADRGLLLKALANLVRNAQQAAPGTVSVAWRRTGARAVIEVTDAGPGVPRADRERVFEPFFTGREGGTGLGLALARDAVRRHGGTLRAEEAAGGGARFVIDIPVGGDA
jgi:signal transduction histidine kinase